MRDGIIAAMVADLDTHIALASASPRRRRLFAMLGLPYSCTATSTAEDLDSPLAANPGALVAALAADKASAAREADFEGPVIAFDTVVLHDSRILGKPSDLDEARRMLAGLAGRMHRVATGVALLAPGDTSPETFAVITPVRMRDLTAEDVDAWIDRGELLGCAGAYNIESHLAEVDLDQCFQNVAGIPLCHVYAALHRRSERLGLPLPTAPVGACDAARQVRCLLGPRLAAEVTLP